LTLFMILLLPLFPAQPLLGPIYVQVDRFMPPDFPLLLVVPALALDLVMRWSGRRVNDWGLALLASLAFVATFLAVQWPFADFLMTPWARNFFFASHRMDYGVDPRCRRAGISWRRRQPGDRTPIADGDRLRVGPLRLVVGQLDVARAAMTFSGRAGSLQLARRPGSPAALSMAHVGSPTRSFGGKAGPYDVRVSVRLPGVIPGRAQVTVRVAGVTTPRRITYGPRRPVERRLEGAPPPETAAPVPGDASLYSSELWFMTPSSYQLAVAIDGPAGRGAVVIPVLALATAERRDAVVARRRARRARDLSGRRDS
jgi:hypothetical protein